MPDDSTDVEGKMIFIKMIIINIAATAFALDAFAERRHGRGPFTEMRMAFLGKRLGESRKFVDSHSTETIDGVVDFRHRMIPRLLHGIAHQLMI